MRAQLFAVLAAALALGLAVGCSTGEAPFETQHDGGLGNHLGDGGFGGTIQLDSGTGGFTPPGGGSDGGTSGGGGGGGTAGTCCAAGCFGDACDGYINSYCCNSLDACLADTACNACLTSSSATGCDTNALFAAFAQCVCGGAGATNECAAECGGSSGGGGGGGTAGTCCDSGCFGDSCDGYINSYCCGSLDACLADTACYDCLTSDTATGCDTNALFGAFADCVCGGAGATNECAAECGGSSGGGGTTGNGVCDSGESTGDTTVDACLSQSCCTQFDACFNNASCVDCMYGAGTGCSSNSTYLAFDNCWTQYCD
jgi:hypothetical protein